MLGGVLAWLREQFHDQRSVRYLRKMEQDKQRRKALLERNLKRLSMARTMYESEDFR
jgi:hypothetical protein